MVEYKGSMEIYLQEDIIQRGLRLKCDATFKEDETFVHDWDEWLHKCSRGLLERLLIKREHLCNNLNEKIYLIHNDLSIHKQHPFFFKYECILTSRVAQIEKDTLERKVKKITDPIL